MRPRALRDPPSDIKPERVFRMLLRTPRAVMPIAYRVRGAEHVPLRVQALRSVEELEAWDMAADIEPEEARESAAISHVIASCLLTPSGLAFDSGEQVAQLSEREVSDLGGAVFVALATVSPTWLRCNWPAWRAFLERGAKHPTNLGEAYTLGLSDIDRYFGLPIGQMTDGQRMVASVCREMAKKLK